MDHGSSRWIDNGLMMDNHPLWIMDHPDPDLQSDLDFYVDQFKTLNIKSNISNKVKGIRRGGPVF